MTPGNGVENATSDNDGPRASVARRYVLGALALLAGVVLVLTTWLVVDVLRVRAALNDAKDQADELTTQLKEVGPGGEQAIASQLARDVVKAREISHGRIWSIGEHLPVIGGDFEVIAETTAAVEEIATEGIPALTRLAAERDSGDLGLANSRIDLSSIRELAPVMGRSDAIFTAGLARFDAIDTSRAHGSVQDALATVGEKLRSAQDVVSRGSRALRLAPAMLGANGPRNYLLVFQNNAEVRSTGGIPGAYAELRAFNGSLAITKQGEGGSTGFFDPPAVRLTDEEKALYGTLPANFWVNANLTPDFPRTAEILRAMYRKRFGRELDGIISVDPVALARILQATGPVRVSKNVALSAENVIPVLLNGVYVKYTDSDDAQNAFFNAVAEKIFTAFVSGRADTVDLVKQLQASLQEGRVIANATRPEEQALLAGTTLAGELRTDTGATPQIGLYLNDSTTAKLQFYLRRETTVTSTSCDPRSRVQTFKVVTDLRSEAPADVTDLGPGVVGEGPGARRGAMRMVLSYYAPLGGKVTAISVDGEQLTVSRNDVQGLFVSTVPIELAPGASHTVVATIRSGPGQQKDANFRTTPGIEVTPNNVAIPSSC